MPRAGAKKRKVSRGAETFLFRQLFRPYFFFFVAFFAAFFVAFFATFFFVVFFLAAFFFVVFFVAFFVAFFAAAFFFAITLSPPFNPLSKVPSLISSFLLRFIIHKYRQNPEQTFINFLITRDLQRFTATSAKRLCLFNRRISHCCAADRRRCRKFVNAFYKP